MTMPPKDGFLDFGDHLRSIRTFVVAVRAGSMSRAALMLGLSQPTVSTHIAELEKAVGQPLLDRKQGGVVLTPFGDRVLQRAAEALDFVNQSMRDVTSNGDPGTGEVRIGASEPYIASGFLAAAVDRAQAHHPQLDITVIEADTGALDFNGLRDRKLDVAVGRMPAPDACSDIQAEVLFYEAIVVATGTKSRWAQAKVESLRDLATARWLVGPPGTTVRALVAKAFQDEGLDLPKGLVSTHSMWLRMQLLAMRDRVTSLPASLLRLNRDKWELHALPITLRQQVPVVVATLRRRHLGASVHLFLDHLRTVTAEMNDGEGSSVA